MGGSKIGENMNWISCKDKTPNNKDLILVYGKTVNTITHQVVRAKFYKGSGSNKEQFISNGHEVRDVEFWMPLPEPPRTN